MHIKKMEFFSQDGQDEFVASLLNNKRGGIFLDIGAYDGVLFSNTYFFEKHLDWTGICIEPNPAIFTELSKNRECICLNSCINNEKGVFKFLSVTGWGVMLSGLMEFIDSAHIERIDKIIAEHGGAKVIIDIPAFPVSEVLSQYAVTEIDYCNIDVEGGELSVLNSIDFCKVQIKIFTIENNYETKKIRRYLRAFGYRMIARVGADDIYELNSKRYGLMMQWRFKKIKSTIGLIIKSIFRRLNSTRK